MDSLDLMWGRTKAFLGSSASRKIMVRAADLGLPPLESLCEKLFKTLGKKIFQNSSFKIITGGHIKRVMREEGFIPDERWVALHGSCEPFKTSSTYVRI